MATNTLIIWLWEESIDNGKTEWRGSVSHVQSGRQVHFRTLTNLFQEIEILVDGSVDEEDFQRNESGSAQQTRT